MLTADGEKMTMQILASLAMMSLVIGTLPSIRSAVKNRNNLSGFSKVGALVILFGQVLYTTYFLLLQDYLTTLLSVPLITYWVFIVIFSTKGENNLSHKYG